MTKWNPTPQQLENVDRLIAQAEKHKRDFDSLSESSRVLCFDDNYEAPFSKMPKRKKCSKVPKHDCRIDEYDTINSQGTLIHVEWRH